MKAEVETVGLRDDVGLPPETVRKLLAENPAINGHVVVFAHYTWSKHPTLTTCNLCGDEHMPGPVAFVMDAAGTSSGIVWVCHACHEAADKDAALRVYLEAKR